MGSFGLFEWFLVALMSTYFTMVANVLFKSKSEEVYRRIQNMHVFAEGTEEEKVMKKSLTKRIYIMLEERTIRVIDKHMRSGNLAPISLKLLQANDYVTTPMQHWAKKIIFGAGGVVLGLLTKDVTLVFLFGGLLFYYPDHKLKEKIQKRQLKMKGELPDFLDLLAATAPSAKNLEDAIKKVCERSEGDITLEFSRALDEVNSGRKMRDALRNFSMRCGIDEIKTLVSQINQAETFGTGVEKTLIMQAEKIRKLKKLLAEIKARKASIMLLLPSMFLLVTIIIMIIGPSIMDMIKAFSMFG